MKANFLKILNKILCSFLFMIGILNVVNAQNVGMGTQTPDPSAALDITALDKGLLIPRVSLQSVDDQVTVPAAATSLIVFNTNEAIKGEDVDGIGFYYNANKPQSIKWVKLSSVSADAWSINGNSGLTVNNFLGTTDDQNIRIKRNGVTAMEILTGGTILATGDNTGVVPSTGGGTKLIWAPAKAAFRAGAVNGTQWDDANVGQNSFAAGLNTKALGVGSVAMGSGTVALAEGSVAMGIKTSATSAADVAMGDNTIASGGASAAFGQSTRALGANSFASGFSTQATNTYSVAMGNSTVAKGIASTALGEFTMATARASLAIGRWNVAYAVDPEQVAANDKVFQIGNGTGPGDRSDALSVERDGDVMIAGCLFAKNGQICGPSDIRLKKNIEPLNDVLSKIANIQPIGFYFKDKKQFPSSHQIGFSAQEIEKAFPELVLSLIHI